MEVDDDVKAIIKELGFSPDLKKLESMLAKQAMLFIYEPPALERILKLRFSGSLPTKLRYCYEATRFYMDEDLELICNLYERDLETFKTIKVELYMNCDYDPNDPSAPSCCYGLPMRAVVFPSL